MNRKKLLSLGLACAVLFGETALQPVAVQAAPQAIMKEESQVVSVQGDAETDTENETQIFDLEDAVKQLQQNEDVETEDATGTTQVLGLQQVYDSESNPATSIAFTYTKATEYPYTQIEIVGGGKTISHISQMSGCVCGSLTPATVYKVRVRGVNALTEAAVTKAGEWTAQVDMVTAPNKDVTGLKQTKTTTTKATVSWSKVSGADGYMVYYGDSKETIKAKPTKSTSFTITIKNHKANAVMVLPYKKAGDYYAEASGDNAKVISVYTKPAKATGVSCPFFDTRNGAAIKCKELTGVVGYQYEAYAPSGKKWKKVDSGSGTNNVLRANKKKVKDGMFYKVRMRGYVKVNGKKVYGAWSAYSYIAGKPTKVTLKGSDGGKVNTLTWSKVTGATSYTIYRSENGKTKGKKLATTTARTYTTRGNSISKRYYYTVVANKKVGTKTYSAEPDTSVYLTYH
ncbi:MAG: hypothetical protein ACI4HI_04840 [Lachnospiraceae bacterium]